MKTVPHPADETERLKTLHALRILDSAHEERFDRITRIARRVFDVPVSIVGFVDRERLWFKSACGIALRETPRDTSFCSATILSDEIMLIPDAMRDPQWADFPPVNAEPGVRFYAGHPLYSAEGRRIGSFCIVDYRPRELSAEDVQLFRDLAALAQSEVLVPRLRNAHLDVVFEREPFDAHPRIDPVTRFWRRQVIREILDRELHKARTERQPVGIMLIGVDGHDELEGLFGRARRDLVVSEAAHSVRSALRPYDSLGQWDKGVFLAVLPGADLARAAVAAERIRQRRAATRIDSPAEPINVTITIAVCSSSELESASADALIDAASTALGLARASGGNRTRLASLARR